MVAVIRVLVVDDQELMRVGFRMVLGAQDDIDVVGEGANGAEAVQLADQLRPDVVLMDVRMPVLDGVEATKRIVEAGTARVLVMTTFDLDEYVYSAIAGRGQRILAEGHPAESSDLGAACGRCRGRGRLAQRDAAAAGPVRRSRPDADAKRVDARCADGPRA